MDISKLPFPAGWIGADLGQYRPCDGTYCYYEYDTLPPLDETRFTGQFEWLKPLSAQLEATMSVHLPPNSHEKALLKNLAQVQKEAEQLGRPLPAEFVAFMQNRAWREAIPSCTACYFDCSGRLVHCPITGGYFVRFYNDQQDCCFWYLYVSPSGEQAVFTSWVMIDEEGFNPAEEEHFAQQIAVCAPSFELFLYRYWLENSLWFGLDEGKNFLTPEFNDYLNHYKGHKMA